MKKKYTTFTKTVWDFYITNGRHDLPWRKTLDPYCILVSEVMLQQTQVDRVVPKYEAFIKRFPTSKQLAEAPLSEVLTLWQGLGYNRRAKALSACARAVVEDHQGTLPRTEKELVALPGIGPYTARAVLAFAFDTALPLIETNVRTVYIHHFFAHDTDVTDVMLLPHIEATLAVDRPRDWYYALMDYGSHLKRTVGNNITKSKHYTPQSKFKGSDRQVRGAIIRALTQASGTLSEARLKAALQKEGLTNNLQFDAQLVRLLKEGMIKKTPKAKTHYQLP